MERPFYYPQLDSIRGLSFIFIFIYHSVKVSTSPDIYSTSIAYIYHNLPLAIDVFFILSSFLLTLIGLKELDKKKSFSYKNFFTRRVLRIWPLYYLIMIFSFLLLPYTAGKLNIGVSLPEPVWYLFFISNFYYIDHVYFLRFLWTLSVEEQFYLILGLCLKFLNRYLTTIFILFAIVSLLFTIVFVESPIAYTHTVTYFFDFALGGLAAIAVFYKAKLVQWLKNLTSWQTLLFYAYFPLHFIILYFLNNVSTASHHNALNILSRHVFIIYFSILIVEQMINMKRSRILEKSRLLVFTGKISYGLYCFHGITLTFGSLLLQRVGSVPMWSQIIILFVVNYGIATLCYYKFELPFLKLKQRFRK